MVHGKHTEKHLSKRKRKSADIWARARSMEIVSVDNNFDYMYFIHVRVMGVAIYGETRAKPDQAKPSTELSYRIIVLHTCALIMYLRNHHDYNKQPLSVKGWYGLTGGRGMGLGGGGEMVEDSLFCRYCNRRLHVIRAFCLLSYTHIFYIILCIILYAHNAHFVSSFGKFFTVFISSWAFCPYKI